MEVLAAQALLVFSAVAGKHRESARRQSSCDGLPMGSHRPVSPIAVVGDAQLSGPKGGAPMTTGAIGGSAGASASAAALGAERRRGGFGAEHLALADIYYLNTVARREDSLQEGAGSGRQVPQGPKPAYDPAGGYKGGSNTG